VSGVKQLIAGIKGSKPGSGPPKPDGHLSKQESYALDAEYRRQRNQSLQLKNHREQMLLAERRGQLIEKKLVQTQAAFLLVGMRRAALALPQALCDRLANIADPLEAKAVLDEAVRGLLTEVADLPNRIDAEAWAKFLAEQTADNGAPAESEERPARAKTVRRRAPLTG
jgi:hypothetical protein